MPKRESNKTGTKGRTSITEKGASLGAASRKRQTMNEFKTQVSRSVKAGAGLKRGNRRDTHPSFSTGKTHTQGGRAGPLGRSTRKGGPETGSGHSARRNSVKAKK